MAVRNVVSAYHGQLSAGVVDTVNMSMFCGTIRIFNRDPTLDIYYRTDGVAPTVGGDQCEVLPPNTDQNLGMSNPSAPQVMMISSGNPTYSVECVG